MRDRNPESVPRLEKSRLRFVYDALYGRGGRRSVVDGAVRREGIEAFAGGCSCDSSSHASSAEMMMKSLYEQKRPPRPRATICGCGPEFQADIVKKTRG